MKSISRVLLLSATLGGVFAACVTQSVASSSRVPKSAPASTRSQVAREPDSAALANKHVTEKNYLRQLKRMEREIAAAEGRLQGLEVTPARPQEPLSSGGGLSK
ncbi:hypothetical protein MYSTI_01557 [Myxococcus stipitatus DSM 14675]|uniref:Lipoprotein n=1 Tax=Myxococcus stipitatus (strain DSM 14675 / JCM 12634 / Mx s8) TaxID=1278073 RepID=L7U5N3_MYXSD|nr:hypothetical protein [Myxococcus stipitatus]AGC42892.1 hypothetical protein MYSTI_01557 [Myxococcus stipitatus DSM 14675]